MAHVTEDGWAARWVAAARRTTGTDWPTVGAALLGTAALVEAAVRGAPSANFPLALVLALASTAPVALGRAQSTLAALLILTAWFITLVSNGQPPLAGIVALGWMLYLAGRTASRQRLVLLAAPLLACGAAALGRPVAFFGLGAAAAALVAGTLRRARADAAARNASVQAMSATLVEHVARGERTRIARELHDVVAHHVSLIALEADAARLATAGMPPEGERRLRVIGDTARTALTEMRTLLGVLRDDALAAEPDLEPQPGLQQLNELLDRSRAAARGTARLIVQGQVRPLAPGVELTAYRIVQEALTNVRRHAPGASVDVELSYDHDCLRVRIRDNGPGCPPGGEVAVGHGLTGMRERAAMLGGHLAAGPGRLDGFVVEASLPLAGRRR
jgi:signal transduction histidine kinase